MEDNSLEISALGLLVLRSSPAPMSLCVCACVQAQVDDTVMMLCTQDISQ